MFRESFLFYFEPEKREVFRAAGEEVFTKIVSGDRYWPEEPWTHARLRALVLDLRWAAQLLAEIGEEPLHSHPEHPDENRLAREAVGWSEEVERLARLILAALEHPVR